MNLRFAQFQRNFRQRLHREVELHPELRSTVAEMGREKWRRRLLTGTCAVFIGAGSGVFIPVLFASFCVGMGALVDGAPNTPAHSIEYSLAISACWLFWLVIVFVDDMKRALLVADDWAVLAHLPVDDRSIEMATWRKALLYALPAVPFLATVYGFHGWKLQFVPLQWLAVLGLILLHLGVLLATLVVLMGYGFRLISGTVLRFIGIAAFLLTVMGSFRELDNNDAFTWIAFLALPQGWINAAFVNGLAREQWEGWLYLAPCLPFILLAIRAVSRLCIIKEYSFSPGLIQVVMRESSLLARRSKSLEQQIEENPALRDRKGKLVRRVAANAADAADTDVALVEARIRQREFLRPLDWRAAGYVERVIGTRLSDRQRLVLEAIEWAGPWRTPNRVLTALVGIGLVILLWAMPPAGLPFLIVLLWGCWVAFSAKGDQKPQRLGRVCSVLPIGYDEPSRALFRATWWSAMLLTPLALMFGLGQALMWNAALDQTLLRVFIGIAAFPAVLPFVVAHSFATIINDKSVWIYPAWLGPVAVFMLAPMVMLIPVPIHLAVAATVTYFLSNVLLWHVYRHLYNRSKLDLLL